MDQVQSAIDKLPHTAGSDSAVLKSVSSAAIGFAGVVAVGFIIYGAYLYVTSMGDPGKVKKAKQTLTYSIIGLIIVLLAFAIVTFVLDELGS